MTGSTSSYQLGSTHDAGARGNVQWALHTASMIKDRWHGGDPPDLAGVLESHPNLKQHRTVVLNLAYEEYRLRLQAGESLDAEKFSQRFQSLGQSLFFLIAVHDLLSGDPDFVALQSDASWPEPGGSFLGFDLLREIGRGAIGRVFLASERALGQRLVALKVAVEGTHEAEILGRLRHPNIVPVYSVQEDPASGLTAFAMPYLGQATLAAVLDKLHAGPRPPQGARAILDAAGAANEGVDAPTSPPPHPLLRGGSYVGGVIHLAAELAEALAYAHAQGVFHRDLKPSNILLSPEGRPLLLDFNLSVDDRHPIWRVGGTLPYMAPEELTTLDAAASRGRSSRYDPRSDIFSLGVIIYELLTGRLPFGTIGYNRPVEEIAAQLRARQAEGPRDLREYNRQVDKRLAGLIERCLAFDAERRPPTAGALAAALRKELAPRRRMARWAVARRRPLLVVALAATLAAAGLAALLALRPPYAVRQLQEGLAHYAAGEDDMAFQCLSASLLADPRSTAALLARAHVRQRQGDFQLAFADYEAVARSAPGPQVDAGMGYCLNRLGQTQQAASFYRRAIQSGYDAPAVLNNLGYCCLRLGQLDDAESCLRRALEADEALQAAHHNLVIVYLQRACAGEAVPPEAFVHARRALETGPESGELCRDLAFLHALAARRDAALAQAAIAFVAKAVARGIGPKVFKSDVAFAALAKDPAFEEALVARATGRGAAQAVRLLDPVEAPR